MAMGSMFGKILGLDPHHTGVPHWWAERISGALLVPLVLWFAVSLVGLDDSTHGAVVAWLSQPLAATLMGVLIVVGFHHTQLGLQVVVEDYIDEGPVRRGLDIAVKLLVLLSALGGLCAVGRIAWAG